MDKFELQKLRELPIEGVAERLGLQVTRHKSLCPFHEDSHPSLSFKVSKNTCRCFVCMTQSIGPIDLVMRHLHLDFKAACKWLADEHNIILDEWKPAPTDEVQKPFDATRYERFFERPFLNNEARHFLFDERRLDPRVVRWCRLTSWKDRQGTSWLQIPYFDREGKLIGIQNRNLTPSKPTTPSKPPRGEASQLPPSGGLGRGLRLGRGSEGVPRFRFPQGSQCGIYNLPVLNLLKPGETLFITEGCSDCWAMLSAGHKAIAIPSATLLKRKDAELLKNLTPSNLPKGEASQLPPSGGLGRGSEGITFAMYPDNDVPGERLFLQLREVLPSLVRYQLPAGCKDFSDYYLTMKKKEADYG